MRSETATAIILAGGRSARMGDDKALLDIGGRPMISLILDRLRPHFEQILVSANDARKYAFLGVEIVPDKVPGLGPLGGIASALERSSNDLNFVVACDIPQIDVEIVKRLLAEAEGHDGAIPRNPDGKIEPLFAVYRKSVLSAVEAALRAGELTTRDAFRNCRIAYVELAAGERLANLNTPSDVEEFGA